MVPIVFAAFANDPSHSLSLIEERDALLHIFNDNSKVELEILENATFDYINRTILNKKIEDRIVVFHYAGHANGKNIQLTDGPVEAAGLAKLLKSFTNLQLVFLNGCETSEQVIAIQKEGVQAAIITTLRPVNDLVATSYSNYFYYAFYRFNTLNDSFQSAETRIVAKFGLEDHYFLKLNRSIGFEDVASIENNLQQNKAVYVITSGDKDFLRRTFLFKINYSPYTSGIQNSYRPIRLLVESLANSIVQGTYINQAFENSIEFSNFKTYYSEYSRLKNNRNFELMCLAVLPLLPTPLSFHVSQLIADAIVWNKPSNEEKIRFLKRQIITYNSLVQLLGFTLLSSFWNELEKKPSLAISTSQWKIIKGFLSSNELNNQEINYPALLVAIREIFENNNLDPFIKEYLQLRNIFENEDDFYATHLQMQGIQSSIFNGEINKMDIEWLCATTEKTLATIFSKAGFIIKYKLTTVKNIEISKSRLKPPSYLIKRIILDGNRASKDDVETYMNYTDTRSVILAKGISPETFTSYLTLSPFIIDENAQKGEDFSKIFFYSHSVEDAYVYRWGENPEDKLIVKKETYEINEDDDEYEIEIKTLLNKRMEAIKSEMDAFKAFIN